MPLLPLSADETPYLPIARHLAAAINRPLAHRPLDAATTDAQAALLARLLAALARGETAVWVDEPNRAWLAREPWVSDGTSVAPVVLTGDRVEFHRYWHAKKKLLARLRAQLAAPRRPLAIASDFFATAAAHGVTDEQQQAIRRALAQAVTLLTGGPGTGKTTTLSWLLAALATPNGDLPPIALAAPTGKAAQRMGEAIAQTLARLPLPPAAREALYALEPQTLHRLLGIGRTPFARFTAERPLPYAWVVVDEASMVDLLLLEKLADALHPAAHLLLIGDPNQLAPVEAGNVFPELIAHLPECHAPLARSHRFGGAIAALATAVLAGDAAAAWRLVSSAGKEARRFASPHGEGATIPPSTPQDPAAEPPAASPPTREAAPQLSEGSVVLLPPTREALLAAADRGYEAYRTVLRTHAVAHRSLPLPEAEARALAATLLAALGQFRIMTTFRHHPAHGAVALNQLLVAHWHRNQGIPLIGERFLFGHALQITTNDYALGLFNGDLGVLLPSPHGLTAWFADATASAEKRTETEKTLHRAGIPPTPAAIRPVPFLHLPAWESAWATTVHKAQGSEFSEALLFLPEPTPVATRALLYTAITRAKQRFWLATTREAFEEGVREDEKR